MQTLCREPERHLLKGQPPFEEEFDPIARAYLARKEHPEDILCARCTAAITRTTEAREVSGAFAHTRVNPAGVEFTFGCFASAPGALVEGVPTLEDSWFGGYRWRYARCGSCQTHLGWCFTRGEDRFYGLILARLKFPG